MKFEQLKEKYKHELIKLIKHPFNQELADGSLGEEQFAYYMQQDALYLIDFAQVLKNIGDCLDNDGHRNKLYQFADETIVFEKEMHAKYFKLFNIKEFNVKQPVCVEYTQFLLNKTSNSDFSIPEALASVLPCFWTYLEIAASISSTRVDNNRYQTWIDLYSSPAFVSATQEIGKIYDYYILEDHNLADKAFKYSMELEYKFWDSSYNLLQHEHIFSVQVC